MKNVFGSDKERVRDSDDSCDDESIEVIPPSTTFKVFPDKKKTAANDDLFVIDISGEVETTKVEKVSTAPKKPSIDKFSQKLMETAVCGPSKEKAYGSTAKLNGRNKLKRMRKEEREKTKGKSWFDMPATELTDEARADLELLRMRAAIDPTARYRRNDRDVLPKYFQVGRVVDSAFQRGISKRNRKRTMLDELVHDGDFEANKKAKYTELVQAQSSRQRRFGRGKKNKKAAR